MLRRFVVLFVALTASHASAETQSTPKWYDTMTLRGFAQLRYNQIGVTNKNLVTEHGDRSVGGNSGFFLRRARVVLTAQPTDRAIVVIQPDFAVTPSTPGPTHLLQMRDFFIDYFLTSDKSSRLRIGQSMVPFGFENMQASWVRLPLDRDDALNSSVFSERDLGVFYYWATPEIRERFKFLVESGLKGSGDFGIFALGAYNGQTSSSQEANRSLHTVARVTYPMELSSGQYVEMSLQGYTGRFVVNKREGVGGLAETTDQRLAASFVYFPQPFGLQAEYTVGRGPELNLSTNAIEEKRLEGGYVLASYRTGEVTPFFRHQAYRGAHKQDVNAIPYKVDESELGLEWQLDKSLKLTAEYMNSARTNPKQPAIREKGRLGRLQLQWAF